MNQKIQKVARMGILIAISIVLVYFVHFPIFPQVGFLEYDPADVSILIVGFAYGPISGIIVTVIASIIQGLTVSSQSGIYGIIMHIIATSFLVGISSFIYQRNKTIKGAIISLAFGCLAMLGAMIIANLIVTPYFMHITVQSLIPLMPFIALFNLIKSIINSIITFFLYKRISSFLHLR